MRRTHLMLIVPLLLVGCATAKTKKKKVEGLPSAAASQTKEGRVYTGLLPCPLDCKSIRTELTLFDEGHRFSMKETVLGSAVGELMIESRGEWSVLTGHGADTKATIFELTSEQFEQERYFLKVNDTTLRALNEQGKEISTTENVTLRQVKR